MDPYFEVEVQFLPGPQDLKLQNTVRILADECASAGIFEYERAEDFSDELFGGEIFATHLSLGQLDLVELGHADDHLQWKVYFEKSALALSFRQKLEALGPDAFLAIRDLALVKDENWKQNWKDFHTPKKIGTAFQVVPFLDSGLDSCRLILDETVDPSKDVFIVPGMGFGTGEHETTNMCLEEIASLAERGLLFTKGLDFGCGSGVLGIAAIKHLKVQMDFFDIDPDALENCQRNYEINFPANKKLLVTPLKSSLSAPSSYQLIFANILQDVLLSEVDFFCQSLAPQGIMLLSGILTEQAPQVLSVYQQKGFSLLKRSERQGWEMLSMQLIS